MARNLLLAVVGLTPQVVTETLYYLTRVQTPPVPINEISVITTRPGRELIEKTLLAPRTGQFHAFCRDYGIPAGGITFNADSIFVVPGPDGRPLEDIRTAAENAALADFILAFIRDRTKDPGTVIHGSLAGGRKTMGIYLALALQLYGRPGDILFHVLVSEEFEGRPDFFYPPPRNRRLKAKGGKVLQTKDARVELATIAIPILSEKLPILREREDLRYHELVERTQREVNLLRSPLPLLVNRTARRLQIGEAEVPLTPLELAVYAWVARRRLEGCGIPACPGCPRCFVSSPELQGEATVAHLRQALVDLGVRDERARRLDGWTGLERFSQVRSKINTKIRTILRDEAWHVFYVIDRKAFVKGGEIHYGLPLEKGLITLQ